MAADRKDVETQSAIPITGKRLFAIAIVTSLAVIVAISLWWFRQPKPADTVGGGSGILATAPPSPPRPLNADGAPKSD